MKLIALATIALLGGLVFASSSYAQSTQTGGPTPSPSGAKAEFLDLKDGAVIGPKTTIHFGLHGMGVAPAGTKKPNTGHFHLLIDRDLPPLDKPIPNDENDLHYGAGQTEVELTLSPGPHTLQLLLGDADHIPHTPPVYSDKIHVTAVEILAGASCGGANSGAGDSTSLAARRARLHHLARERLVHAEHLHRSVWTYKDGSRAGRVRQAEHRPPPSPGRRAPAAVGQADPQRRKPFAFRRRPDGSHRSPCQPASTLSSFCWGTPPTSRTTRRSIPIRSSSLSACRRPRRHARFGVTASTIITVKACREEEP